MRGGWPPRPGFLALGLLLASLLAAVPLSAQAAVAASLSSKEGRPGDLILFTIPPAYAGLRGATPGGRLPVYLIATDAFDRMIAKYGYIDCSAEGQVLLGYVTWSGDSGMLTFPVPNVAPGQYYLEVEVRNAWPSCWRVGELGPGVLSLSVGNQPAAALSPGAPPPDSSAADTTPPSRLPQASRSLSPPFSWQLIIVVGGLGALAASLMLAGVLILRRRGSAT